MGGPPARPARARALDAAIPAIPLAQAFGRWGNYFNQELFGTPTTVPWALEVDPEHRPDRYADFATFHPTFLYESLYNLGVVVVLLRVSATRRLRPGSLSLLYLVLYGAGRFGLELLRTDTTYRLLGLSRNAWISLALVVGGSCGCGCGSAAGRPPRPTTTPRSGNGHPEVPGRDRHHAPGRAGGRPHPGAGRGRGPARGEPARARRPRGPDDRRRGRHRLVPRLPPRFAPSPFPASLCLSVNEVIVHGIPDRHRLRAGDVLSIDCGAVVDGYHADGRDRARGRDRPGRGPALEATERALWAGIAQARVGNRLSDISHAVGQVAHAAGYGILADHGGHGVGQLLHEDPSVDNDGRPGRGPRLRDGLVLAIEPMFVDGDPAYVHRPDGWAVATRDGSWAAHFEHTVAVLDGARSR